MEKMSKEAAAVIWNTVNVTQTAAKMICCHLSFVFDTRIQVPIKEVENLGGGYIIPFFDSY